MDEVVEVAPPHTELIPVDYKLARKVAYHYKLQITAYAILLEETFHLPARRGFLYLIPLRRAEEVPVTPALRCRLHKLLDDMRLIAQQERMPPPVDRPSRCVNCEFKRFCNDV